mmetsp:Transcript_19196/g.38919  ORF Transcript_19196/g.38919 Transcript_19196/m.38919 type:complete len:261 (-) Transcript_19196:82-864(-)
MAVVVSMASSTKADGSDTSTLDPPAAARELSDYERARANSIERNNARLRALGLISALEERLSNDAAWGRSNEKRSRESVDVPPCESEEEDEDWVDPRNPSGSQRTSKNKRKRRSTTSTTAGSRKSLRLQGISVEGTKLATKDGEDSESYAENMKKEREERVKECREVRLRAAKAVAEAGAEKAAKENPTATYEHCLMRVKTMSEKGLANRVKAIERAAGRHCVVKMAIFKSCLQDEGMWDLAELARQALERLKGLLPPAE